MRVVAVSEAVARVASLGTKIFMGLSLLFNSSILHIFVDFDRKKLASTLPFMGYLSPSPLPHKLRL